MCRYAMSGPYKIHFACFACRKAFKQPTFEDWSRVRGRENTLGLSLSEIESEYRNATFKCPDCSEPMADMGRDFKAPRKNDRRAWDAVSKIFTLGHAFHTCGCNGPGFIPASESEYRRYLNAKREEYQRQVDYYEKTSPMAIDERRDAARYWRERVSTIDAAIAKNAG